MNQMKYFVASILLASCSAYADDKLENWQIVVAPVVVNETGTGKTYIGDMAKVNAPVASRPAPPSEIPGLSGQPAPRDPTASDGQEDDVQDLATQSTKRLVDSFGDEGLRVINDSAAGVGSVLIVKTTIDYYPGKRMLRLFLGHFDGPGKANVRVVMETIEKSTGRVIASKTAWDALGSAFLGGSASSMLTGALDQAWYDTMETLRSPETLQPKPAADDAKARLAKLKEMLDAGLITSQDYDAKKAEILKAM